MKIDITLRSVRITDAENLLPIFQDRDVVKLTNFRQFNDYASLEVFLSKFLELYRGASNQFGPFVIIFEDQIAGVCGLQHKDENAAELWYMLGKKYWGKKIAKMSVSKLLEFANSNKTLHTIYAEAVDSNPASWKILNSFGFQLVKEVTNGFVKGNVTEDLRIYTLQLPAN